MYTHPIFTPVQEAAVLGFVLHPSSSTSLTKLLLVAQLSLECTRASGE